MIFRPNLRFYSSPTSPSSTWFLSSSPPFSTPSSPTCSSAPGTRFSITPFQNILQYYTDSARGIDKRFFNIAYVPEVAAACVFSFVFQYVLGCQGKSIIGLTLKIFVQWKIFLQIDFISQKISRCKS